MKNIFWYFAIIIGLALLAVLSPLLLLVFLLPMPTRKRLATKMRALGEKIEGKKK